MNLVSGQFYHIYNRGNNSKPIFFGRENYIFFLKKVRTHLFPFMDIIAYCLMPNHFHFLIYIPENSSGDSKSPDEEISKKVTDGIAVILRSYTRAVNKSKNWTGSLFAHKTKCKHLINNVGNYPFVCFHYIHQNPVKAKLASQMEDWEFSSYLDYAGIRNGSLCSFEKAYRFLEIPEHKDQFIALSKRVVVSYQVSLD